VTDRGGERSNGKAKETDMNCDKRDRDIDRDRDTQRRIKKSTGIHKWNPFKKFDSMLYEALLVNGSKKRHLKPKLGAAE